MGDKGLDVSVVSGHGALSPPGFQSLFLQGRRGTLRDTNVPLNLRNDPQIHLPQIRGHHQVPDYAKQETPLQPALVPGAVESPLRRLAEVP
jgi:hypothetical protein